MKRLAFAVLAVSVSLAAQAKAADFMQVYLQAVQSDPKFKQAYANYQIAKENIPISRAQLLPQIDLTGALQYEWEKDYYKNSTSSTGTASSGVSQNEERTKSYNYGLSLTQQIFNFTDWQNLASADVSERSAFATYTYSIQDLIERTATAYFDVLRARDNVIYTKAELRAFKRQYLQAKESYEVGVKTLTDVENAKAQYDTTRSNLVAAENTLMDKREDLRVITGKYYAHLQTLKRLPLVKPMPANINAWVKTSSSRSWQIIASKFDVLAARYNILSAEGGHLPTIDFESSYTNNYDKTLGRDANDRQQDFTNSLNLTMPIYSGGEVSATVDQNIDKYRLSSAQLEQTYRDTLNTARQSYLGVISGISKVQADYQAIISNESSVKGTEEGYKVGTQTMLNVLQAQQNLYDALRTYSNDRYDYILNLVKLKAAAGTLSIKDVGAINQWLLPTSHTSRHTGYKKPHAKKPVKKAAS